MKSPSPTVTTQKDVDQKKQQFNLEVPKDKFIANYIGTGKKVLDVGCFTGYCSKAFQEMGNTVVGIDASSPAIKKAQECYPDLEFYCIDAMNLTTRFPSDTFDIVVTSEVIEHVLDPKIFLKAINQILRLGGLLILTTQNSNALHLRLRMLIGKFRWDFKHFRLYSKPEIVHEIRNGGFDIEVVKVVPINPYGPSKLMRSFVYYIAKIYPNFGWTTCVVAKKLKNAPLEI